MARLPYRNREELPEKYQYLFDNLSRDGRPPGNIFRTLAYSPHLMHQFMRLGNAILSHTQLDPKLRELAILTVGRVTEAPYEYAHHVEIGKRAGITDEQIAALPVWQRHPAFNAQERAVIRYAEEVTRDVRVADATFTACHAFLGDEQMTELAIATGFYNFVVRVLEPMQVDLE